MTTIPVQVDEETLVREFVKQIVLPAGVKLSRVKDSVDSTGDPALRIYFSVSKRIPVTAKRIADLGVLKDQVSRKVFDARLPQWPIVHFEEVR